MLLRSLWFALVLGLASPLVTCAEEPSTGGQESPGGSSAQQGVEGAPAGEPEPAPGPEPDGRPREPRFLPPRLRPRVLTPEELEEAQRLRELAAKFGTDPTAIVSRVQLTSQYFDLPQGAQAAETVARVDLAFRGNWLLRVDTPFFRWNDPNRPGTTSAQGMGDLAAVLGWRAYNTPEYAFFIGPIFTFPTASESTVGLGKYTAGPIIATARFLPRLDSFLFGVFQHQVSVGGDPARAGVELSQATLQINTFWGERWWTSVQGAWRVDWERSAKSSMALEFELGRRFVESFAMYARPGVGIWGRDVIGAYDWNIEVGIRRTFPSF